MTVLLPDVSEFQAPASGNAPNWAGIKSQNGGAAIIRVGYGNGHLDGMLVSNRSTIKGLKFSFCGLYQYLRAGQDVPSQANAFIDWIGPKLNPGEIPILDLEEGSGSQLARANQWFSIIDAEYGLTALPLSQRSWIYSGNNFAGTSGLGPIFSSARRSWVAAYQSSEVGLLPHSLWQSTNGSVGANITSWSGCGRVDTSIYHSTLDALASLGWHPQTSPPAVEDPNPALEEEMLIPNDKKTHAIAFGNGQYDWISFFADPSVESKTAQALRVAPWDATTGVGFSGITTITVDQTDEKVTVNLPAHCAGISIQRSDDPSNWVPVAYNLGSNS